MKKVTVIFGALFFALFMMTSCGGKSSSESDFDKTIEQLDEMRNLTDSNLDDSDESSTSDESSDVLEEEKLSSSSGSDCDEFLKGYEKFMDKYIAIVKKQKNNPTDMSIMSEYSSMMSEASEWADKITDDCANNPDFMAKYTKIQMKIANAASGI
ncbi:MAG: hypothetical protein M9897_09255 [Brumimicrobium sp.]|nr:hypothetical protein [Brumimicrobium sp.]